MFIRFSRADIDSALTQSDRLIYAEPINGNFQHHRFPMMLSQQKTKLPVYDEAGATGYYIMRGSMLYFAMMPYMFYNMRKYEYLYMLCRRLGVRMAKMYLQRGYAFMMFRIPDHILDWLCAGSGTVNRAAESEMSSSFNDFVIEHGKDHVYYRRLEFVDIGCKCGKNFQAVYYSDHNNRIPRDFMKTLLVDFQKTICECFNEQINSISH